MGMVTAASALLASSTHTLRRRGSLPAVPRLRLRPASPGVGALRLDNFVRRCYVINVEVDVGNVNEEEAFDDHPSLPPGCSIPVVHILGDVLDSSPFPLHDSTPHATDFEELPVLSEGEQHTLAATPAHPAGLYDIGRASLPAIHLRWNFNTPLTSCMQLCMLATCLVTLWNNYGILPGLLPWQFFIQAYCLSLLLASSESSQYLSGHQ